MTLIVPAILGGVALSVMALVSFAAARRKAAQPAGLRRVDLPKILVHDINDDRCTGCDACVAVCPTNVLDLVDNKSRVLNFADCIQCEACMWACPTEALVMHPEGSTPPMLRMPELDEQYQTMVPGQYLIGEVAGKPLIKNAANLGRGVIEHMMAAGLKPGALTRSGSFAEGSDAADVTCVDVAIVGSGPGGLSAALTCIQRGLSYVVLEKDNVIASTISHYPKGKLVMAEPYTAPNLSMLPVFDTSKEKLVSTWERLVSDVGMNIKLGEAVEAVERHDSNGTFAVRTNVAAYRVQRVVLATGTRGKPRTLGVAGENLAKVSSLLDDPDEFRGQAVLVVGGGDSAVEAALALADAGAKVIMSYRGRAFSRAQPKNKNAIEAYAAQKRVKLKYQSVIECFEDETVTLVMADGTRKKYPNHAAFVLIGADPPIKWLNRMGIEFVDKPHQFKLADSAELVQRFVTDAIPCPESPAQAAALVRGQSLGALSLRAGSEAGRTGGDATNPLADHADMGRPVSGPRRWLRSATNMFSMGRNKPLDRPIPLSEFAQQRKARSHTGHGRRDDLEPGERTRVLRMLRDEGGRLADEDSQVFVIESRSEVIFDSPPPDFKIEELRRRRPNVDDPPPKQAVIVGLARAMAEGPGGQPRRKRRTTAPPRSALSKAPDGVPPRKESRSARRAQPAAPLNLPESEHRASVARHQKQAPAPPSLSRRAPAAHRPKPPQARSKRRTGAPAFPSRPEFSDEPTRQVDNASALANLLVADHTRDGDLDHGVGESTRAVDLNASDLMGQVDALDAAEFMSSDVIVSQATTGAIAIETGAFARHPPHFLDVEDARDESTLAVDISDLARIEKVYAKQRAGVDVHDHATKTIDIGNLDSETSENSRDERANSMSDIDWDLD